MLPRTPWIPVVISLRANILTSSEVWSNAAFLFPAAFMGYHHMIPGAILALLVCVASTLYHASDRKWWHLFDVISAYSLVMHNAIILALSHFKEPYTLAACLSVAVGFYYFYAKGKDDWEWHIVSAIITLICALAYAQS